MRHVCAAICYCGIELYQLRDRYGVNLWLRDLLRQLRIETYQLHGKYNVNV
jgi:hypothetical protein